MAKRLSDAEKSMVGSVSEFFEKEKDGDHRLHVRNVVRRTALACSVSESTVIRCRRRSSGGKYYCATEEEDVEQAKMGRPAIVLDEFTMACVRRVVHAFYRRNEQPTLEKVLTCCEEEIEGLPSLSLTAFWRIMKAIGFRYRRTKGIRRS